jgi:hypothetical protein
VSSAGRGGGGGNRSVLLESGGGSEPSGADELRKWLARLDGGGAGNDDATEAERRELARTLPKVCRRRGLAFGRVTNDRPVSVTSPTGLRLARKARTFWRSSSRPFSAFMTLASHCAMS